MATTKLTRRQLAGLVAAAAPAAARPAAQAASSAAEELRTQQEQVAQNARQLATHRIPMAVEPAFVFKP